MQSSHSRFEHKSLSPENIFASGTDITIKAVQIGHDAVRSAQRIVSREDLPQ